MKQDRQEFILRKLRQQNEIRITEIHAALPEVSEMTVRRDLDEMAEQGLLVRTHGGARRVPEVVPHKYDFESRSHLNLSAKTTIAQLSRHMIPANQSAYFEAGSTIMELVKQIGKHKLHAVTNAPNIALELCKHPEIQTISLGGPVNPRTLSVTGPMALENLKQINLDIAFLSASGFSPESGFTNAYIEECILKQTVIQMAQHIVVLLDHSKFGQVLPFTFAQPKQINTIVTDQKPDDKTIAYLEENQVQIVYPTGI